MLPAWQRMWGTPSSVMGTIVLAVLVASSSFARLARADMGRRLTDELGEHVGLDSLSPARANASVDESIACLPPFTKLSPTRANASVNEGITCLPPLTQFANEPNTSRADERNISVMICMTADLKVAFMYKPVFSTLVAGFQNYAQMRPPHALQLVAEPRRCAALHADGVLPDIFIWVGLQGHRQVPWMKLRARGVYTVYYRTEPTEPCMSGMQVSETWEYTHARSGGTCPHPAPRSRYLPPGAPTGEAASSALLHGAGHPAKPTLHFIGTMGDVYPRRKNCFLDFNRLNDTTPVQLFDNLWTERNWERVMPSITAVLNLHKLCGDPRQPLEALRVVKLLSYGCNVISERSNSQDEDAFSGLVTFAPVEGLPAAWARLATASAAERAAAGAAVRARFFAMFTPDALFQSAGIYELLDAMRRRRRGPMNGFSSETPNLPWLRAAASNNASAGQAKHGEAVVDHRHSSAA